MITFVNNNNANNNTVAVEIRVCFSVVSLMTYALSISVRYYFKFDRAAIMLRFVAPSSKSITLNKAMVY